MLTATLRIVPPSNGKNGTLGLDLVEIRTALNGAAATPSASYASRPDAGLAVLIATRLPAHVAARRSDRRPNRLGGADPRGAGVRDDRWCLAGRRALCV